MILWAAHPQAMLIEIYIEALLVDEEMADLVWEAWVPSWFPTRERPGHGC